MNRFEAAYARWVMEHRLLIIVVCLAAVTALSYGNVKSRFDTSYRVYFSDDNPELLAFENVVEHLRQRRQHYHHTRTAGWRRLHAR